MNSAEKLRLLRQRMQEQGMDAYVVVTDDFHGSEYVGDYFKAREYLSGFTGSAGTLVVLPDSAALWTDGRYFLQAADQLAGSTIDLMRAGQPGVPTIGAFLAQRVPQGGTVGFDGRTVSSLFARTMAAALEGRTSASPMSRIWPGLCGRTGRRCRRSRCGSCRRSAPG
ncbi:MAG: aminopeptidase P family N-terminal domain-containing protein [Vescimonas sp.]